MRRFDTLTFDCYGTLIDWERGISEAFAAAARADGVALDLGAVLRAYHEVEPRVQAERAPEEGRKKLYAIRGQVPPATLFPEGCRFHPRCPHAMDICTWSEPPPFHVGEGHMAACWLHDDTGVVSEEPGSAAKETKKAADERE